MKFQAAVQTVFLSIILVLAGCSAESKLAGEWSEQSKSNNIFANMAVQGGPKAKLVLTSDHKFTLETETVRRDFRNPNSAVNEGKKVEGTYEIADKEITFHTLTVDGQPAAEFAAREKDEIKSGQAGLTQLFTSTPNSSQLTPEEQKKLQEMQVEMSKDVSKLTQMLLTPLPTSGSVNDRFNTIEMTCDGGRAMEFGKRLAK